MDKRIRIHGHDVHGIHLELCITPRELISIKPLDLKKHFDCSAKEIMDVWNFCNDRVKKWTVESLYLLLPYVYAKQKEFLKEYCPENSTVYTLTKPTKPRIRFTFPDCYLYTRSC